MTLDYIFICLACTLPIVSILGWFWWHVITMPEIDDGTNTKYILFVFCVIIVFIIVFFSFLFLL